MLVLCFVQICSLFPWSVPYNQNQEKGKDIWAMRHLEYEQWFV